MGAKSQTSELKMRFKKVKWCEVWVETFIELKLVSILLLCKRIHFSYEFVTAVLLYIIL